jgi:hypothetical protein
MRGMYTHAEGLDENWSLSIHSTAKVHISPFQWSSLHQSVDGSLLA